MNALIKYVIVLATFVVCCGVCNSKNIETPVKRLPIAQQLPVYNRPKRELQKIPGMPDHLHKRLVYCYNLMNGKNGTETAKNKSFWQKVGEKLKEIGQQIGNFFKTLFKIKDKKKKLPSCEELMKSVQQEGNKSKANSGHGTHTVTTTSANSQHTTKSGNTLRTTQSTRSNAVTTKSNQPTTSVYPKTGATDNNRPTTVSVMKTTTMATKATTIVRNDKTNTIATKGVDKKEKQSPRVVRD